MKKGIFTTENMKKIIEEDGIFMTSFKTTTTVTLTIRAQDSEDAAEALAEALENISDQGTYAHSRNGSEVDVGFSFGELEYPEEDPEQ